MKNQFKVLGLALTLVIHSPGVMAKRLKMNGALEGGNTPVNNTPVEGLGVEGEVHRGGEVNCSASDRGGYLSLNFLRTLVDGAGENPNELKVIYKDGRARLSLPRYAKPCTDLKIEYVKAGKNVFFRVKNAYSFSLENDLPRGTNNELAEAIRLGTYDYDDLSEEDKYYLCMESKGLIKDESINRDIIVNNSIQVGGSMLSPEYVVDIGNGKESIKAYFASAKPSDYDFPFAANNVKSYPKGMECFQYENFSEDKETVLFESDIDKMINQAITACEEKNAIKILDAREQLKNAGNYPEVLAILDKTFDHIQDERAKEIYEELKKLEKELKPEKDEYISEDEAKEKAARYAELVEELKTIIIKPSVARIEELMSIRNNSNRDEVDDEIKRLNDKIARFFKDHSKKLRDFVMPTLEHYALDKEALSIEGIRLASANYRNVYSEAKGRGRDKRLSIKQASEKIVRDLKNFEKKEISRWHDDYAARNGSKEPALAARRRAAAMKRRITDEERNFQQRERQGSQSCTNNMLGQARNPVACRRWHQSRERRYKVFEARRSRLLGYARDNINDYNRYRSSYEEWRETQTDRDYDEYDPYGYYGRSRTPYDQYDVFDDFDGGGYGNFSNGSPYSMGGFNSNSRMPAQFGQQQYAQGPAGMNGMGMMGYPQMNGMGNNFGPTQIYAPGGSPMMNQGMMPQQGHNPYFNGGNPYGGGPSGQQPYSPFGIR